LTDAIEILVQERRAEAMSGTGKQRLDGPIADRGAQGIDSFDGREVRLDRRHFETGRPQRLGSLVDRRFVGGDDQIGTRRRLLSSFFLFLFLFL
jgi:hypothetical protein